MKIFTDSEIDFLKENYPEKGKMYCCEKMSRTEPSIRRKVAQLGLRLKLDSDFFKDFQNRAKNTKIGKKRPWQSQVMKELHKAWKLKKTEEQRIQIWIKSKKRIQEQWHPRGMLWKKHSQETKDIISENSKLFQNNLTTKQKTDMAKKWIATKISNWTYLNMVRSSNAHSRTKSGKRNDLDNQFFRSASEANFARYLKYTWTKFEFETKEFFFKDIKRGSRFYICDFYIPEKDIYYEFKGWLDSKSITKLKRMRKYHPIEFDKLYIVKQSLNKKDFWNLIKIWFSPHKIIDFKTIEQFKWIIPHWE